jgi:6-pyruvoyltetrahydropterin/6-carboxytetrahydropterin synthase
VLQQIYPSIPHSYQYELNKDFHFAAAHYVPHDGAGKCRQMHGHTYFANVTIVGDKLDSSGFLVNFSIVKKLIHDRFDHKALNDDLLFNDLDENRIPSTEILAKTIHDIIQEHLDIQLNKPSCIQVFLRETPTSYVVYRPKVENRDE